MKRRGWRLGIWTTVVMVALGVGGMARADGMGDVAGANADGANGTIRLATYNIQNGREMNRAELTLEKTAEAIDRLNADVVGLQEVDRNTYRVDDLDLATELSKRVGRVSTYGKAIDLGEGEYGIAILSRNKPISIENIPLPGAEEKRTLLIVEFDDFFFFDTHFSLTKESRKESAAIVNEQMLRRDKPVILVGDMNVESDAERAELFGDYWTVLTPDAPTWPADSPRLRLDYIQIADPTGVIPVDDPRWTENVLHAEVVEEPVASDHRPVIVDLRRAIFSLPLRAGK